MADDYVVTVDHGEWYQDEAGQFRFRVVAPNGKILAWGESYVDARDCRATLRALIGENRPMIEGTAERVIS